MGAHREDTDVKKERTEMKHAVTKLGKPSGKKAPRRPCSPEVRGHRLWTLFEYKTKCPFPKSPDA